MNRFFQQYITIVICFSFFLIACESPNAKIKTSEEDTEEPMNGNSTATELAQDTVIEGSAYQLVSLANNLAYQNYSLELVSNHTENLKEGIQLLQLKVVDENSRPLERSEDLKVGLLINNEFQGIKSLDDLNFEVNLLYGNNVVFAYIIDELENSIKSPSAAVLKNFYIGSEEGSFDENSAHLFYIKPVKENLTKTTEDLQLDFYLFNAPLGDSEYMVKFSIDSEVFYIDSWQGYLIKGLSKGKHHLRVQLIDKKGNVVLGPFNDSALRTIEF